jgi:hypothetical protein
MIIEDPEEEEEEEEEEEDEDKKRIHFPNTCNPLSWWRICIDSLDESVCVDMFGKGSFFM